MIILDASFIVKLVIEEPESTLAEKTLIDLLEQGEEASTIDIALAEALNALWKHHITIKDIDEKTLKEAIRDLLNLWTKLNILSTYELSLKAINIAITDNITIYDALYIAAAIKYRAGLATFDQKQREIAKKREIPIHP